MVNIPAIQGHGGAIGLEVREHDQVNLLDPNGLGVVLARVDDAVDELFEDLVHDLDSAFFSGAGKVEYDDRLPGNGLGDRMQ